MSTTHHDTHNHSVSCKQSSCYTNKHAWSVGNKAQQQQHTTIMGKSIAAAQGTATNYNRGHLFHDRNLAGRHHSTCCTSAVQPASRHTTYSPQPAGASAAQVQSTQSTSAYTYKHTAGHGQSGQIASKDECRHHLPHHHSLPLFYWRRCFIKTFSCRVLQTQHMSKRSSLHCTQRTDRS